MTTTAADYQSPNALYMLAAAARQVVADYYDLYHAALYPLPAYRAVDFAQPVADCEKFCVQVFSTAHHQGSIVTDQPDVLGVGRAARYARLFLWVIRCVPVVTDAGDGPTVDETETASELILSDATILTNAILHGVDNGYLPGCASVSFEGWFNMVADGGMGGGYLIARLNLMDWS